MKNETVRRHGKHCFCAECLQDEMNAKDDRIDELERQLANAQLMIVELQAELGDGIH